MSEQQHLHQKLWAIANELRGNMNADEFRDYILGFIFYKYLSDKMRKVANQLLETEGITYDQIDSESEEGKAYLEAIKDEVVGSESGRGTLGYFLQPNELFAYLAKKGNQEEEKDVFILEDVQKTLINIQNSTMGTDSEEDFDNLFEEMDLNNSKLGRTAEQRNKMVAKIMYHLSQIDFKLDETERDVLGDAYEYLIGEFASGAGKKAGEFYTPQQVSKLLAKIVSTGKDNLRSVYDPTCGSGSLLLRVAREVKGKVGTFYGQEMNPTTYNLARMNMIMHDVHYSDFDIKNEDTLEHPQHIGMTFDAIVANPPFSAKWSANKLFETDERFSSYGRLAPAGRADYAFIQHMIHHLNEEATMAVVMPHGVLFRGGAEGHIRQYLIETKNYLDAVIGLPENLFYGTSIPTSILVFKKCRKVDDSILFIDASKHFERVKTQNILREEDIQRIYEAYLKRESIEKFAEPISLAEIAENDYNLNIPRYVDTFEEEEKVDLEAVALDLIALEEKINTVDQSIADFCKELNIKTPF